MIRSLSRLSLLMLVSLAASLVLADDKKESTKFEMTKEEQNVPGLAEQGADQAELPALTPNPLLFQAARGHSANMAKQREDGTRTRRQDGRRSGSRPGLRLGQSSREYRGQRRRAAAPGRDRQELDGVQDSS